MSRILFSCGHELEFPELKKSMITGATCGRCVQRLALIEIIDAAYVEWGKDGPTTAVTTWRQFLADYLLAHHPILRRDNSETIGLPVAGYRDTPDYVLDHVNSVLGNATTGSFELTVSMAHGSE